MTVAAISTVAMPRLSDSMEEGVIVSWLVSDGDQVEVGQEIAEVETDKATMPYEAEAAGKIHLRAAEGETVRVGDVIALIGELGTDQSAVSGPPDGQSRQAVAPRSASPHLGTHPAPGDDVGQRTSSNGGGARRNASPVARRLAAELGVDLSALTGSGPGGRVVKADVQAAAYVAAEAPSPPTVESNAPEPPRSATEGAAKGESVRQELSRVQALIARRMAESKATAPDFVLRMDVDMEAAVAVRTQLRAIVGPESRVPSFNDFVVKACATALRENPLANGSVRRRRVRASQPRQRRDRRRRARRFGGADDLRRRPEVAGRDRSTVSAASGEGARRNDHAARAGRGTFSVSNLGMFGVDEFSAVINPPQAAILAVGALKQRAVVIDGQLAARHTMTIALSCDHRILYGANAAEFLARIRRALETPGSLVL